MCVECREGGESRMHCLGILKALMWLTEGPDRMPGMMETEENREKVFVLSNAFIKLRTSTNSPGLNYLETFRL